MSRFSASACLLALLCGCLTRTSLGVLPADEQGDAAAPDAGPPTRLESLRSALRGRWCGSWAVDLGPLGERREDEVQMVFTSRRYEVSCECEGSFMRPLGVPSSIGASSLAAFGPFVGGADYGLSQVTLDGAGWGTAEEHREDDVLEVRLQNVRIDGDTLTFERKPRELPVVPNVPDAPDVPDVPVVTKVEAQRCDDP